jgi:hypothetical protein
MYRSAERDPLVVTDRPAGQNMRIGLKRRHDRQRAAFFARLRGGVNSSAIAAIVDGTRR